MAFLLTRVKAVVAVTNQRTLKLYWLRATKVNHTKGLMLTIFNGCVYISKVTNTVDCAKDEKLYLFTDQVNIKCILLIILKELALRRT